MIIEKLILRLFEEVFKRRLTSSAMIFIDENHQIQQQKPKENISNQDLKIQLKAIDMLAYMAHECQDEDIFQATVTMINSSIVGENLWKHPYEAGASGQQGNYSSLFVEMNILMKQSLTRMIQVFKLNVLSAQKAYKSILILRMLIAIFKTDVFEKREVIYNEVMKHIQISRQGDLCWMSKDCPLMIGFAEYANINCCSLCHPPEDQTEVEYIKKSYKMVLCLQDFIWAFLYQQVLANDSFLNFKLNCLKTVKNILFDLFASEDYLHQVKSRNDRDHQWKVPMLDLSSITRELLTHIDIEYNIDCSKLILEIIHFIIGSQSFGDSNCRKSRLQLQEALQFEIFNKILASSRAAFHKFHSRTESGNEIRGSTQKIPTMQSIDQTAEGKEEAAQKGRATLYKTAMNNEDGKPQALRPTVSQKAKKEESIH